MSTQISGDDTRLIFFTAYEHTAHLFEVQMNGDFVDLPFAWTLEV